MQQNKKTCAPEKQIYFTLDPLTATQGIGVHLHTFRIIYMLGLSLGYTYLHQHQMICRSTMPALSFLNPNDSSKKTANSIKYGFLTYQKFLSKIGIYLNPYDFLGINQYFLKNKQYLNPQQLDRKFTVIDCLLCNRILTENNVSSFEELRKFIKNKMPKSSSEDKPLIQRFKAIETIRFTNINPELFHYKKIALKTNFLKVNRHRLKKPLFPTGRIKTLLHIRLGDRATIKTPWGRHLRVSLIGSTSDKFTEYANEGDFNQLTVADFDLFLRRLITHFRKNTFALQITSDGYESFFRQIKWIYQKFGAASGLTFDQIRTLRRHQRIYEQELNDLQNAGDIILNCGERVKNLFNTITACVDADLIITAFPFQHRFLVEMENFFEMCTDLSNAPLIILLHKPLAPAASPNQKNHWNMSIMRLPPEIRKRTLFVNIRNPDFPRIAHWLSKGEA